jgi:YidC/Oxa1 family membrane protein insertase
MQQSQRVLMMVLPFAFIPFIIRFPTGLVLYWMTTNLWTVGQGLITRRLIPKVAAPTPQKRSSRTPPKAPEPAQAQAAAPAEAPTPSPSQPRRVKRKKKARR